MKKIFFVFLVLLQLSAKSQYLVNYNFIMKSYDSFGESKSVSKGYLYTNEVKSKYIFSRVLNGKYEEVTVHSNKDIEKSSNDRNENQRGDGIGSNVMNNFETDSTFSRVFLNDKNKYFLIKEKNEKLDWKIVNEYKTISELKCQKATTNYNGRDFFVWFTNQIPVSSGPWKFSGLPGLILEVSTFDGNKKYEVTELKKIDYKEFNEAFSVMPKMEIITFENYKKSIVGQVEKIFKYKKSQSPDSDFQISIDDLQFPLIEFK
ncbi:GLPGLI family protein [Flavobacterium psychrotolerans]|uniref:GLPGLI family protein n=1 Tax=Flavobacterium psychrotolerans TaxID=2169410 RepID=A0A2U1JNL9_9FLAO|nr:GLPGLI family protein [Flavobacterium psychrotolerans]PWA06564.1 hypothetical protein DB895_03880 [Flavobacterium psychrotolerans]